MHTRIRSSTVIMFTAIVLAYLCEAAGPKSAEVSCADRLVQSYALRHGIPGIASAVIVNGTLVYNQSYGNAHVELKVPVSASVIFQLSSTAKLFTGVLAMRLVEQRQIDLDKPVTDYLTDAPEGWKSLKIRHCLSNSSGLPDVAEVPGALEGKSQGSTVLKQLYKLAPKPNAGKEFKYGDAGFFVAQQIIERVTGDKFADIVRTEVFDRAGMVATSFWTSEFQVIPNTATDYYPDGVGSLRKREFLFPPYMFAAGGIASSVEDLLRFEFALSQGVLLRSDSISEMWKPLQLRDGSIVSYGLGWDTKTHAPGKHSAGHSGGYLTTFRKYLESRITVVLLTNGYVTQFNPDDFATALASVWDPSIIGFSKRACEIEQLQDAQL